MRLILLLGVLFAAACAATRDGPAPPVVAAPDIPDTDIFLGELRDAGGGRAADGFRNVTDREGYDNQPYFIPDEDAFYYVAEVEGGKTDILQYDLKTGESAPVFQSAERSEYSPRTAPGGALSYIQENPAGDVTRVHRRAPNAPDGAPVAEFAPVGYYAWLDGGRALAVYYRTEPGSLYRIDLASGEPALLREKIGRAMQANAAGDVLWFTMFDDGDKPAFRLMRLDAATGEQTALFPLPEGAQDFAIEFNGAGAAAGVYSASGSTLFWRTFESSAGADWTVAADLAPVGVGNASRIAVDAPRGRIAVVGEIRR